MKLVLADGMIDGFPEKLWRAEQQCRGEKESCEKGCPEEMQPSDILNVFLCNAVIDTLSAMCMGTSRRSSSGKGIFLRG